MNYSGDVDYMTADDGTKYYPPAMYDFKLTNLKAGSEIGIYKDSDKSEIYHLESSGTEATHSYQYIGDIDVYVIIHHIDYVPILMDTIVLSNADQSIPVSQQFDRNYKNP